MLLTNKIYEGNLFMRYSKHLTYAERMFLRARLNRVRHITLDPDGPGVVRIHLVPCHKPDRETPFTAILNGQDILPLNVSWAILLTNFIEALKPYTGKEIRPEEWNAINAQAVAATRKIYRKSITKTKTNQIIALKIWNGVTVFIIRITERALSAPKKRGLVTDS